MTFSQIMNSPLMYILVMLGIGYVLLFSVFTLMRSYRHALAVGLDKKKVRGVIASSALYSVVPSLSIVVGLFSLAAVLGIPWSWFRLSVVGSVTYELMAADMVGTAAGYESIAALNASGDSQMIGTIMFVMSICIMGGIVGSLIFTKGIQKGLNKAHDKGVFGILAANVLSLAMLCAYVPIQVMNGPVFAAVLLTSLSVAALHKWIIKTFGCKWLNNFVMADSLLISMASSLLWLKLFG